MRVALKSFGRYVPKEVVKKFIDQRQTIDTSTERRDLTILFSDIENFTTISETISSETLTQLLSAYFGYFSKIIVENEGTIDKYIGDSMMAFWNAPNYVIDHGQKACYAALKFMKILKNEDEKNILMKAKTRFGIHSGEVLVGNIGTQERLNYTVIGNAVNTASRLESLNKTYGTTILISESTHEKIGLRFISRPIDFIVVKGRTQGITIFEILGLQEENQELSATPQERELSSLFSKAYAEFQSGHLDMAKKLFYEIIEKFPNDQPTKIYLERLKES
ncbi:MAG: adenylate/guanylate cyclase domain-containing protein [Chlamydiae bacterium]|nr:adenylate/guanylate cyclase domain-containing protein [Chlamydiota bacterium]